MQVTIDKARERPAEYYFRLILNSDLPEEQQAVREFTYGKEMPLGRIRDEIVAIITNDYGDHPEDVLEYEGDVIEV